MRLNAGTEGRHIVLTRQAALYVNQDPMRCAYRERKFADTIDTVPVPWTGYFQC